MGILNNSESNKIRKVSYLIKYMHSKISNSQKILRMLCYNTKNPLALQGLGYKGEKVNQPNLDSDRVAGHIHEVGFNPNMTLEAKNQIFINLVNGRFNNESGKFNIDINILTPEPFAKITNGYRQFEIAQEIANLLDETSIEEEDVLNFKDLGNLKFELTNIANGRISKTENYSWFNMSFEVKMLGTKYRINSR